MAAEPRRDEHQGSKTSGVTRYAVISVAELRRRLGERMTVAIDVTLPSLAVVASRSVPDRPVTGSVVIESIERGVTVHGSVRFDWTGECRRCLEEVSGHLESEIDEIYQIGAPADSDLIELLEDKVDLLPLVRDAVLAGLPLAPLCRPDCAGPDPERYPTLLEPDELSEPPEADPRWAGLSALVLGQ
ncbi:MAG: YceD family protein, partial [Actinomycetota bacterium]|nr:YceD family protein [Actinomycetota bacterium]